MRHRGFTLIELLVVVSIISILAAISVANLLEAQTRAKVTRVHSDLRTVATSIEAYMVDNGRPAYDGEPGFAFYGWNNALVQLTTPIAYQTTVLPDLFQDSGVGEPTRPGHTHYIDAPAKSRHSYDYSTAYWNEVGLDQARTEEWRHNFGYSAWKLTSAGPDRQFVNAGSFFGTREIYDPTNGTVSQGDIIRTAHGNTSARVIP